MNRLLLWLVLLLAFPLVAQAAPRLQVVASFPDQEVTGVGVSKKSGRIFVNFPDWSDKFKYSVAEIGADGQPTPYPDAAWNAKSGDPAKRFVCVQSVVVGDDDNLYVLDPASPKLEAVVPGGAKLVKIDLATNKVVRVYSFNDQVTPKKSYLNDVRIDLPNHTAYMTESGVGSIVVLDLNTGQARALLRSHYSTKADPTIKIVIDGIRPIDVKTGLSPSFNADGIALDQAKGILYYHPLTSYSLFKIPTADLRNEALSEKDLGDRVIKIANTHIPDGMLESADGSVYLTDVEEDSVDRFDPSTGKITTVVQDKRLQWPDTMAWGPNQTLYVTASQIHRMPSFNAGVSKQDGPFKLFKLHID
jgi:sugar lactone lactonase YvrE